MEIRNIFKISDMLYEGESKSYRIEGYLYELNVLIVSETDKENLELTTKLMINGEVTKELSAGQEYVLENKSIITVSEIFTNNKKNEDKKCIVSFYIIRE